MKLELDANEMAILLREYRYVKTRVKNQELTGTESDYHEIISRKWGKLPLDIELDEEGNPVVKAAPVPPDFRGIMPGD